MIQNRGMRGIGGFWILAMGVALAFQAPGKPPTYSHNIRPILAAKCVACHHTEGLGPFALQTYEQVRKRGDLIRQVALTGQMPPTDARSDYQTLTSCPPLNAKELLHIQEWYRLGMPKGATTKPLEGPAKRKAFLSDHVVTTFVGKGQVIRAEGRSARVVYAVPMPQGGLGYLHYFSFQPDSPKAVRQAVLAVQRPGQPVPFTSAGIRPGTPALAWGDGFTSWGSGSGYIPVDKEDRLWLQIQAVPTGKPEPASGLITFAREYKYEKVAARSLGNNTFTVDADSQTVLRDEWVLDHDIDLISALPEARFATEQVKLTAKTGDLTKTVLLVLTWDPVWPGAYNFREPIRLKKGTTLIYESMINNSKHGHAAEDEKPKPLTFGPNPQDELFWCHLTYIPR